MTKWDSSQVCKACSINVIYHINRLQKKSLRIISIEEKAFDKIQDIHDEFSKVRIEGNFLNLIFKNLQMSIANIILNIEKLDAFSQDQDQGKDLSYHSYATS